MAKIVKGCFVETNNGLMVKVDDKLYGLSKEMIRLQKQLEEDSDELLEKYLKYVTNETELVFIRYEIERRKCKECKNVIRV